MSLIKNDELIVLYGNKLCKNYKDPRHQDLIRSILRLLGRFLQEMKKLDNTITDFASLIAAHQYDNCVKAVDTLAGLQDDGRFKNFSVATRIGTLLKKVATHYRTICIKQNKRDLVTGIEDFLNVLQDEYTTDVNKTAADTQSHIFRTKVFTLPTEEDVKKLYSYVTSNMALI